MKPAISPFSIKYLLRNFWFRTINISVFLLLASYYVVFLHRKDLVLFPGNPDFSVSFFTDSSFNGNSTVLNSHTLDSLIYFEFILGDSIEFSYAGFDVLYSGAHLDVSGYNEFFIEDSSGTPIHMWLFANMKDKNIRDTSIYNGLRRTSTDFELEDRKEKQYFPFREFSSPFWWYDEVNQFKKDFGDPEWERFKSLTINNGLNIDKGKKYSFSVFKIGLTRDNTPAFLAMLGIQLFSLAGSVFLPLFVREKKRPVEKVNENKDQVEIVYRPVETSENEHRNTNDFLSYIHQNFSDSELTLQKIAKETGISPRTISDYIAEKFNCNLKTYINQIRINEAKRLLRKSDLNINQIAYQVGFNSPANFNRVFKKITNMSPTEYLQGDEM